MRTVRCSGRRGLGGGVVSAQGRVCLGCVCLGGVSARYPLCEQNDWQTPVKGKSLISLILSVNVSKSTFNV